MMRRDRDVRRAMKGVPSFRYIFSQNQSASSLWDYGEDGLVDRALAMSESDLEAVQRIAAVYRDPTYPLPVEGQRITSNHVVALAAIAYLEGRLRPLAQNRRRPRSRRPPHLTDAPVDPGHG